MKEDQFLETWWEGTLEKLGKSILSGWTNAEAMCSKQVGVFQDALSSQCAVRVMQMMDTKR